MNEMELARRAMIGIRNEAVRSQHKLRQELATPNIHPETAMVLKTAIKTYDALIQQYDKEIDNLGRLLEKENND